MASLIVKKYTRVFSCIVSVCISPLSHALTFNLNDLNGNIANTQFETGFNQAAAFWESQFDDLVTVNLDIDIQSLSPTVLGGADSNRQITLYSDIHNALVNDSLSVFDAAAIASLDNITNVDGGVNVYLNRTFDNPNGEGSATPYLDTGFDPINGAITLSTANAKALGLRDANDATTDANIVFNSDFTWDFDSSDGISAGAIDFVGVAIHEIGHALGFLSGVDELDFITANIGTFSSTDFALNASGVHALDLFRYSNDSIALNALDWTADNRSKYFFSDNTALFSTGKNFGDGRQASHWKDHLGLGLMDPTFAFGQTGVFTELDLLAFDAIGWDVANTTVVPIPNAIWLFGSGILGLSLLQRLKNHKLAV